LGKNTERRERIHYFKEVTVQSKNCVEVSDHSGTVFEEEDFLDL